MMTDDLGFSARQSQLAYENYDDSPKGKNTLQPPSINVKKASERAAPAAAESVTTFSQDNGAENMTADALAKQFYLGFVTKSPPSPILVRKLIENAVLNDTQNIKSQQDSDARVDLITKQTPFKGKSALEWLQQTDVGNDAEKNRVWQEGMGLLTSFYPDLEQFIN